MMDPKKKYTLIGASGGLFSACYSNAVRHEPMMKSMHFRSVAAFVPIHVLEQICRPA